MSEQVQVLVEDLPYGLRQLSVVDLGFCIARWWGTSGAGDEERGADGGDEQAHHSPG